MLLVKPDLPPSETGSEQQQHPWARRIKDAFSNKIKYAHNSVISNPTYPNEKEKIPPDPKRTKFTIIGDRITREFIYCANLVRGLYKYRKRVFEAPVIQGVNTVEWPTIWNDLKIRYGGMAFCLTSSVAVIMNKKFLGGEQELRDLIESKFTYYLTIDYCKKSINEFARFIRGSGRPCVYMKISIDGEEAGNFIFMLYSDILPSTCANFLRLCRDTKGGYSGTPIHRIVKNGWIQGGGFGLKETDLGCENFIVPHDRRGVLGMANSGVNMECSTQFFVLLQPAPWMARRFVAFGQLIEGKGTLDKIEAIPTWYESPNSEIMIYKAGIFNMDCHDIMINKSANEYIDRHIEDLNELGEVFYEELLQNVFLTAQLRELERLKQQEGEGGDDEAAAGLRETQRFNRKKEDIEKQLQTSKGERPSRPSTAVSKGAASAAPRPASAASPNENNEFDVETYDPEYEDIDYQHQSILTPSLVVKPKRPFYIPLTDVLYPGEKDSNFDLKRFLQGDYCLESDLKVPPKSAIPQEGLQFSSELFNIGSDSDSVNRNEEREIKKYLKSDVDRVSYAGGVVKTIGKGATKFDITDDKWKSDLLTDDQLRRLRRAAAEFKRTLHDKKVSINLPNERPTNTQIKRRQTGFIRPADLPKFTGYSMHRSSDDTGDDDDDDDNKDADDEKKKVRIADDTEGSKEKVKRRPTSYARSVPIDADYDDSDDDDDDDYQDAPNIRQSVLARLFDEVQGADKAPTLKDYKPLSESHPKNILTFSSNYRIRSELESTRDQQKYFRPSITVESDSYEHVLNIQHGKKMTRKMSSDYVKTIDQIEHKIENSIRSVEYAKTRPAISVAEYQQKNRQYQEQRTSTSTKPRWKGLRLPGDTPLHSSEELDVSDNNNGKEKTNRNKQRHHSRAYSIA